MDILKEDDQEPARKDDSLRPVYPANEQIDTRRIERAIAKIADRAVAIEVGKINLHNNWNTALRYDAKEKILYVKPHVEESAKTNGLSHGDMLLNALLMGLSDLEFPIEMKDIQPIATEMNGTNIIINVEILNIYAEGDKLFIEFRPMAQKQK